MTLSYIRLETKNNILSALRLMVQRLGMLQRTTCVCTYAVDKNSYSTVCINYVNDLALTFHMATGCFITCILYNGTSIRNPLS